MRDVEQFGKELEAFSDDKFTEIKKKRAEVDELQTSGFQASVSQPGECV